MNTHIALHVKNEYQGSSQERGVKSLCDETGKGSWLVG